MKIISWVVGIVLVLVLAWLALLNNQPTTVSVLEGMQYTLPLIFWLVIFVLLGVCLGVLMVLPKHVGLRWEARGLRKANEKTKATLAQQQTQIASLNNSKTPSSL